MILWHKSPLLSAQLLWINPRHRQPARHCAGYGGRGERRDGPRPEAQNEGIFAHGLGVRVALQGFMFAALTLAGFLIGERSAGLAGGQTMAFMVLALSQIGRRSTCARSTPCSRSARSRTAT